MSKVKIQGHASGSGVLTVTAPNTSTDRTITLPDATGTLLNSDGDGSSLTGISSVGGATGVDFNDNVKARFGTGNDFQFQHDGTNSYIHNYTGDLYIQNGGDDKDIILRSDDGSGGMTAYITLDGSESNISIVKHTVHPDDIYTAWGNANDFYVKHNGTNTEIINSTGNILISNYQDDGDIVFASDDGSGGLATYMYLDGGNTRVQFNKSARFVDSATLTLGTSDDLQIYHDGTDSHIRNTQDSGDFIIRQSVNDKDLIFQCDDGSGGDTAYLTLDGSQGFTTVQKDMQFADNIGAKFGAGNDLRIDHDGSNSSIVNNTGNLTIKNNTDDGDIVFQSDDGSGGVTTYFTIDGGDTEVIFSKNIVCLDNVKAKFGGGNDLEIYHDGSNSYISDSGTGVLYIRSGGSTSVTVNGVNTTFAGDITVGDDIFIADSGIINLGSGNDMILFHDGADAIIRNNTGHTYFDNLASDKDIYFRGSDAGSTITALTLDMSDLGTAIFNNGIIMPNYLYHTGDTDTYIGYSAANTFLVVTGGGTRMTVTNDGVGIGASPSGGYGLNMGGHINMQANDIYGADNCQLLLGGSQDLQLYHDATNSYMVNDTGNLYIRNSANDSDIIFQSDDGSGGTTAYITCDGSTTKTVFNKPSQRTFEVSSSTDGDANGDIVYFGGTTSMTVGTIYHYKSDGTWEVANPNAAATSDGLLAVALGAASDTDGMLLRGMVTLDHDPGAVGDVLFLSAASTGDATATAPAGNGDIVRVIGYQVGHASNGLIWFNPDGTFVEVTA